MRLPQPLRDAFVQPEAGAERFLRKLSLLHQFPQLARHVAALCHAGCRVPAVGIATKSAGPLCRPAIAPSGFGRDQPPARDSRMT